MLSDEESYISTDLAMAVLQVCGQNENTEIILSQNNVMPLVRENLWNVRRGWFLTFSEGFSFILRRKVFAIAVKVLGKEPFYELELAF